MSTADMKKVPCPIFDGHEYPKWKAMMKKRLMVMNSELWAVTEIGLTDLCKMAEADDIRKYTQLNLTAKAVICSSLCQNQFRNIMHLDQAKLMWDRLSDVYEGHQTCHDPWFEDFKESLKSMTFEPESSSSSPCLMADGEQVTECYLSESSDDESGDEFGPSYVKLASLAAKQQRALERANNMLSKSNDMLSEEMDQSQALGESLQRLYSKYDSLQDQHNTLLSDLDKLRVSYEDLQKERDSLLAQQISAAQEEFIPPCLKCIERESANSSPECSNASNVTNSSPVSAITNSSSEDIASITDDAGLKELYMTGMYKSLKGHQTLFDVLKKQILNRNPRKEGIAFERKLNADGTYWKPEQYPKTTWVAAKGPPVDPSDLSGYTCESSHSSDESFDFNYKLFKNQNGEVFARYVGTNCRNGSPMKKIWVPKSCLKSLQVNVLMTPPVKKRNPRPNSSYGPNSSRGSNSSHGSKSSYEHHRANNSVSQGRAKGSDYEHYSSNHYVHKSSKKFSAYAYAYPNPSYVKRNGLAALPPFSYGARRMMNSLPPLQMWVVKKRN